MKFRPNLQAIRTVVSQLHAGSTRGVLSGALSLATERVRRVQPVPVEGEIGQDAPIELLNWSVIENILIVRLAVTNPHSPAAPIAAYVDTGRVMLALPTSALSGRLAVIHLPPGGEPPTLVFRLPGGRYVHHHDPASLGLREDRAALLFLRFASELRSRRPGSVVEIGSRARSGNVYKDALVPAEWEYVGVDVVAGENVDVVGDAHDLEAVVPRASFDAAYSIATFEHLAMPWVAAVSINRVLRPGGLLFVGSHQSYPLHEVPWDFFRFSDEAWTSLFNQQTGFEVLDTALGEQAYVVPRYGKTGRVAGVEGGPAFLSSSVLAVKRGEASSTWAPGPRDISRRYPA